MDVAVPDRFAIVRELGAGGMGRVFEAVDRELEVPVALKILHEGDGEAIEKLKHEFRVASDVRHENLVKLGELFEHEHRWCFSMELIEGTDLISHVTVRDRPSSEPKTLKRGKRELDTDQGEGSRRWDGALAGTLGFDADKLRAAIAQLAKGLAALHRAGIVHRDVKPSNIRVRVDGRVVLLDLGLAAVTSDLRESTFVAGTVEYMAPEQAQGAVVGTAADLYAIGAVLYEALVGRPPFIGPIASVLAEKAIADPLPPAVLFPEVPPDLDRICMALLARDPARRPTAEAVAAQLSAAAPAPAIAPRPPRPARAFVGRDAELDALLDAVEQINVPILRVVEGPSGIGKTRLLGRLAQACRDRGGFVCSGHCRVREHVRLNAWEALLDELTRLLSTMSRTTRQRILPPDAEAISRLFPIFARVLPVSSTSTSPAPELERRALAALRILLTRVAAAMRVVVVIDDIQWATSDSLELLARLLEPPGTPPIALILGLRTSEAPPEALARLLALAIDRHTIALGPLAPEAALELALTLLPDSKRAERIAIESGGQPLFLEMMATSSQGSDTLHRTMKRQLGELGAAQRDLISVLAVAGAPLRLDLLGTILGRDWFALVDDLRSLIHQRLVTVTGLRRADHAEPFHAQIAEAALGLASPEQLRADHARLAAALETTQFLDPERRALHWAWAGHGERAVDEACALVAGARHALAYSRAADVCAALLARELADPQRRRLERAHAEALAGSGLAMRAAIAFRDAALAATDDTERLDLERHAAENFLRCGSVEEGRALFDRVAGGIGYRASSSVAATIASLLVERARLRLRGLAPKRGDLDAELATRSDVCYSLSTGLAMVDAISGALFQARSTRFALDCGDPARAARALAIEACFVAAWGSKTRSRAAPIVEAAAELAVEVGDPKLLGFVETARGICASQWGDFAAGVAHCETALEIYRQHCAGVVWEERTGEVFSIWNIAWQGDWGEVARRCEALSRSGAATGERYAIMHAAIGPAIYGELASDDPARARARIADVMAGWPRGKLDLPLVRELVALGIVGIYEGRGREVLAELQARWRELSRSRMLGLEPIFITLGEMRMRAALIAGDWDEARTWANKIGYVGWGAAIANLGHAALAFRIGDRERALERLVAAEAVAATAGVELYGLVAKHRRGELVGGEEGKAAIEGARTGIAQRGIRNIDRALDALAPWPAPQR